MLPEGFRKLPERSRKLTERFGMLRPRSHKQFNLRHLRNLRFPPLFPRIFDFSLAVSLPIRRMERRTHEKETHAEPSPDI